MNVRSLLVNRRFHLVSLLAIGWFLILGTRYVVPAILPQIVTEFELTNANAGFAISVLWFMYAATQFPAGVLTDRFGERLILVSSLVLSLVSLFIFASVTVFAVFLLSCIFFGAASGFYGPPRATILSRLFPENAGIVFGFTLATGSVGAAAIPVVAAFVATEFGWRVSFLMLVPATALICIGVAAVIPGPTDDTDDEDAEEVDGSSISRLTSAVSHRFVLPAAVAATLMTFSFQALTSFFPIYLIEMKSIPQSQAALLYGMVFVSGAVAQPVSGIAADRFGYRRLLVILSGVSVLPFFLLPFVYGVVPLAALAVLFGTQHGIVPVNNAYTVGVLPSSIQGTAWGLIRTSMFAIGAGGSLFLGTLADVNLFDEAFIVLAVVGVATTLLYWALPPTLEPIETA